MPKYILKRAVALGIVIVFFIIAIIPNLNGDISRIPRIIESSGYNVSTTNDSWTMNKHNPQNTGYTPSTGPLTNTVRWTFQTNQFVFWTPIVVDNKVYVGSSEEYFYCMDADTGSIIWEYKNWSMLQTTSSGCVINDTVYFCYSYGIKCLDANNGEFIWNYPTGFSYWSGLVVANDKLYATSYGEIVGLYCLDLDTGEVIWDNLNYDGGWVSYPTVYNGKVYVGNNSDMIYGAVKCFDADTGEMLWNYTTGEFAYSTPTIYDDKVYISGDGLHCLDTETGEELWTYPSPDGNTSYGPSVAYGNIYYLGRYGTIFCLDALSGVEVWNITVGIDIYELGPQFVSIADSKIYICSFSTGILYCMDAFNGDLIWNYQICWPGDGFVSPSIVNGRLFISSGVKGKVFCFEDNSGPPTEPVIDGPANGKTKMGYDFNFKSNEPDKDGVYYYIDWGDGTFVNWSGPFTPNEEITFNHTWFEKGNFSIRAKSRDIFGAESNWSYFNIEIPRFKLSNFSLLFRIFRQLSIIQKVIYSLYNIKEGGRKNNY